MRTFSEALDKATMLFRRTGRPVYIIYNHVKCTYRTSARIKYSVNEELANMVNGQN